MRVPQYISPSGFAVYKEDKIQFYLNYLHDNRPPREPQTQPMAVGSSFDAYVKSYLHEKLFGKNDPRFELMTIFEAQVEPHNRSEALIAGKIVFEEYKKSGCLVDLMRELSASVTEPRFEFELKGIIDGRKEGVTKNIGGVPLLGKPDLLYTNKQGAKVIHDWKVNGYYSKWGASPCVGYAKLRVDGRDLGPHKSVLLSQYKGIYINNGITLEFLQEDWSRQLSIYAWLCGEEVGSDFIASVDQIACRNNEFKFAEHRSRIGSSYQYTLFAELETLWSIITETPFWYFRDMPLEVSQQRTDLLNASNYSENIFG